MYTRSKYLLYLSLILLISPFLYPTQENIIAQKLAPYQEFLDSGTYEAASVQQMKIKPKSRYHTFKLAFEHFANNNGTVIVELGTTRSFVHGGLPGCCSDDTRYWTPENPERWDWGAGGFTRMAALCLAHCNPIIHTIDLDGGAIRRCQLITKDFKNIIKYHVCTSQYFLSQCAPESIDLLYMDTGGIDLETARLHLEEAKIIVARGVVKKGGIILIDDVKNFIPGDASNLGKAKFSIPFLLEHGFVIIADEYQVIMLRVA